MRRYADGNHRVPNVNANSDGDFNFNLGGFNVNFSARDHVASQFVDLSMLTGDGKVSH